MIYIMLVVYREGCYTEMLANMAREGWKERLGEYRKSCCLIPDHVWRRLLHLFELMPLDENIINYNDVV